MYKKVTSIVITAHLLFMMLLLFNPHTLPARRDKHVKVRTVRPIATPQKVAVARPSTPKPTAKHTPKPSAKPASTPKAAPVVKKPATSNKPSVNEKGKPKKKIVEKKPEPREEIWNEIDQALAKIEKKSYSAPKHSVEIPKPLVFFDDFGVGAEDESDISRLMGFLHDTLQPPEVGEVKIELTVRKNGTISKVVILNAESKKNRDYLQKNLPLLQLPIQLDKDKTWIITFCNEI